MAEFEPDSLQYETLRARFEIREYYLNTIVKEIYENIGQVLSLVRVQLYLFDLAGKCTDKEKIDYSGKLVGSAIRDLRNLGHRLQAEPVIINCESFGKVIEEEVKYIYPAATCIVINNQYSLQKIGSEKALILFNILLEILIMLKEDNAGNLVVFRIAWFKNKMELIIQYTGKHITRRDFNRHVRSSDLSMAERIKLLDGFFETGRGNHDKRKIKLVISINR